MSLTPRTSLYLHTVLIVLIIATRAFGLADYPVSLNQDEVSAIVESKALLLTQADRWGNHLPIYFPSWGSGMNVLYSYLSVPFVHWLGMNELSMRLLQVLANLGILALVYNLTYVLTRKRELALVGLGLAAFANPFLVSAFWGLEAGLAPLFFLLTVRLMLSTRPAAWFFVPLSTTLTLLSYAMSLFWIIPLIVGYLILHRKHFWIHLEPLLTGALFASPLLAPFVWFLLVNHAGFPEPHGFFLTIPKLAATRLEQSLDTPWQALGENLLHFVSGFHDGNIWTSSQTSSYLPNLWFALFWCTTLVLLIRTWRTLSIPLKTTTLPFLGLLPVLFLFPLNASRANSLLFLVLPLGLSLIPPRIPKWLRPDAIILTGIICTWGVVSYFTSYQALLRSTAFVGVPEVVRQAEQEATTRDLPVFVSESLPLNYVWVLYASDYNPAEFQANPHFPDENGYEVVKNYRYFIFEKPTTYPDTWLSIQDPTDEPCQNAQSLAGTHRYQLLLCTSTKMPK
jgi:hypothetical protein